MVNYNYLGLGVAAQVTYPQPGIQYTLLGSGGGNDPVTGDIYKGLDLFGRIKDCRWFNTATNADVDRILYGYDSASNRIWRQNPVATAAGAQFDEHYHNDGLQRLKDMQRGTLNGSNTAITSPTFAQCWTLDPTGNWRGFNEATTGGSWTTVQTRSANAVNEITNITNSIGGSWAIPAYDAAGNMTTIPQLANLSGSYAGTYDAWNRLVRLVDVNSGHTIQQNQYDARTFRTIIMSYTGGVLSQTRHSYFSSGWRCIEERIGTATTADRQFVWGVRYTNDIVLRDSGSQRLFAAQDGNYNVMSVIDTAATVQERYAYSAYGMPSVFTSLFETRSASSYSWETLFCGYRFDSWSNLFQVRFRTYQSAVGTWCQREPLAGLVVFAPYEYAGSRPNDAVDPFGLQDGSTSTALYSLPYVNLDSDPDSGIAGALHEPSNTIQVKGIFDAEAKLKAYISDHAHAQARNGCGVCLRHLTLSTHGSTDAPPINSSPNFYMKPASARASHVTEGSESISALGIIFYLAYMNDEALPVEYRVFDGPPKIVTSAPEERAINSIVTMVRFLCQGGTLEFNACYLGANGKFPQQMKRLLASIGRSDINVKTFPGPCQFSWGTL